jgi:general secretion pathway protein L
MRSLLPFSLEDHFASEIDELHFAAGTPLAGGQISTTVVEKAELQAWLDTLAQAAIHPHALFAVCDGVPNTPSTTLFIADGPAVLGRRPDRPPFQFDDLQLDEVWALLDNEDEQAPDLQHVMIYGDGNALRQRSGEIELLRSRVADLEVRELREGPLSLLAATLISTGGTNLLQGEFSPRSNLRAALRPWHAAAMLAGALLALGLLNTGIDYLKLRQATAVLTQQTDTICAETFGLSLQSACRAEAQRRLASIGQSAASGQASFLSTLAIVADAIDIAGFEALSYRNRTLDLDMLVPDVSALDNFSQRVGNSQRFEVRTLSNTPQDDGLRSRIQVIPAQ